MHPPTPFSPTGGKTKKSPTRISGVAVQASARAIAKSRCAASRLAKQDCNTHGSTPVASTKEAVLNYQKPSIQCSDGTRTPLSVTPISATSTCRQILPCGYPVQSGKAYGLHVAGHFKSLLPRESLSFTTPIGRVSGPGDTCRIRSPRRLGSQCQF